MVETNQGGVLDDKMGGAVIERSGNFGLQESKGMMDGRGMMKSDGWTPWSQPRQRRRMTQPSTE